MLKLKAEEVAKKLALPTKEWAGNCYSIACAMVEAGLVPGGIPRYGHYLGPVAEGTMFWGKPIVRHGWIEYRDEELDATLIIDPTRWVFEGKNPYIYNAPDFDGYYDIGGSSFATGMILHRDPPENDGKGEQLAIPKGAHGEAIRHLLGGYSGDTLNFDQLGFIANHPPHLLCGKAEKIYKWLDKHGHKCLVPIDFWDQTMEG